MLIYPISKRSGKGKYFNSTHASLTLQTFVEFNTNSSIILCSLPKNDQMMTQSQVMCTQSSAGSQFSTDDDLLSNPLIMPLSDILQLEQVYLFS